MTRAYLKELNRRFIETDSPITDQELIDLIDLYMDLDRNSTCLDKGLSLFAGEISRRLERLQGYRTARAIGNYNKRILTI